MRYSGRGHKTLEHVERTEYSFEALVWPEIMKYCTAQRCVNNLRLDDKNSSDGHTKCASLARKVDQYCTVQQQQSKIKYDGHREPLYYKRVGQPGEGLYSTIQYESRAHSRNQNFKVDSNARVDRLR
jgi:hypothetical protein